ncbi:integrase catalytic domain-containing protein, partial [Trichonephila clavata]
YDPSNLKGQPIGVFNATTAEDSLKIGTSDEAFLNLQGLRAMNANRTTYVMDFTGFVSPFVFIIKWLMQEIWEYGLGWDEELPTELRKNGKLGALRSELELKNLWKVINDVAVKVFYASHKIRWQFIIERAAWWGGFYERLIRTVKLALRKTVRKTTLSRDELETLLIEIEGVLNSRPRTYIFADLNEPEPFTSSHMILGRRMNSLPPSRLNFNSNLSNRKILIKRFNYRERLLNMF